MKEPPQEYIKRITGYVEGEQPLKVQATTAKKLEGLIRGVPTSKLRKRPVPDKWSVCEILAHLAEIKGAQEIYYPGRPHGLTATHQDEVNADLLKFLKSVQQVRKAA